MQCILFHRHNKQNPSAVSYLSALRLGQGPGAPSGAFSSRPLHMSMIVIKECHTCTYTCKCTNTYTHYSTIQYNIYFYIYRKFLKAAQEVIFLISIDEWYTHKIPSEFIVNYSKVTNVISLSISSRKLSTTGIKRQHTVGFPCRAAANNKIHLFLNYKNTVSPGISMNKTQILRFLQIKKSIAYSRFNDNLSKSS